MTSLRLTRRFTHDQSADRAAWLENQGLFDKCAVRVGPVPDTFSFLGGCGLRLIFHL